MTQEEILISKLTLFLKRFNVYEEYIDGLAKWGSCGKTIDKVAAWCIKRDAVSLL